MSKETIQYQAELIRQSIEILRDILRELEQGKELSEFEQSNLAVTMSQFEHVRDIALAKTEEEKEKVMNRWL